MSQINIGPIPTSTIEIRDIAKSWIIISLAFAFIYSNASIINGSIGRAFSGLFLFYFIVALFTAGLGFLLHEMAHKFVAQHYGCVAEFRAWDALLYFALGLSVFIGVLFAAPGAVMISGMITRKENGIISAAGPLTNYVLGILFFALMFLFPAWIQIFSIGMRINIWLGLFNMIPFGNFDGVKIFYWNKAIWGAMVAFGILFLFVLPRV